MVAGAGITVNALGWWDQSPETPLASSHQVGIWDLGGNLLASTTVATGDPLTGAFRYAAIASLALTGGTSYLIGGSDTLADNDDYSSSVNSLVMDPLIAYAGAARNNANGFSAPTTVTSNTGGRFGPSFDFTDNAAVSPVPEPTSLALSLVGVALLAAGAARRRKA